MKLASNRRVETKDNLENKKPSKTSPKGPSDSPNRSQGASNCSKIVPGCSQDAPKTLPKRSKTVPRRSQDAPKTPLRCLKSICDAKILPKMASGRQNTSKTYSQPLKNLGLQNALKGWSDLGSK